MFWWFGTREWPGAAVRFGLLGLCALIPAFAAAAAQAAGPPQVPAAWATEVGSTSARLNAEINPNGFATTYHFNYITLAAFEKTGFTGAAKAPVGADPAIGSGSATLSPAQSLSALKAETAYRYRVVASNTAGTTPGPEHTFVTQGAGGPLALLDGRGWEMVSPVDKNGGEVQGFGGGGNVLQAAAAGEAASFGSTSSFAGGGQGAPGVSQYLSRRGAGSWTTQNITVPQLSAGYGEGPDANPYRLFTPDLASSLLSNGQRCRGVAGECAVANPPLAGSGAPAGYRNYYLRNGAGGYQALLTGADIGGLALGPQHFELRFVGSSPDLAHVILSTCAALSSAATEVPSGEGCDPAATNLYEWSQGGGLTLLNLLPGATTGATGAALAAPAGAVSIDGSRVYWSQGGNLYLREAGVSKQVDEAEGGGGSFQTATPDGSVAFFSKGGHLFRYEAASEASTDLTPGGGIEGVLGASQDGSYLYYLTAAGLFARHGAMTTEVAPSGAAPAADPSTYPPATGTSRLSADGSRLAFVSKASLTEYDNVGQASGAPVSEVFLYDATANGGAGSLACVSCNRTLERPLGPSTLPGAIGGGEGSELVPAYKPRALSADGRRLFFDSADALVLQDTSNRPDAYEWEAQGVGSCVRAGGCVNLISSGRSPDSDSRGASFADASVDGSDAFFLTDSSLVPSDPGSIDLYDARVGGGFPIPPTPIPCEGDACQPLPSPPEDPTPGTLVPAAPNPPLSFPETPKKKTHKKKGAKKAHHKKKHGKGAKRSHRKAGRR
ncbi:MAG TPA: hypothetical protein VH275_06380 [Solirubrobacterales bacterium]|jgi:hypothetical protein|nr:hypothetical protein [Solirubrobacterales bacterium]